MYISSEENAMLLQNGATIKNDVIETFELAIRSTQNIDQGLWTTNFWNFVESDMHIALSGIYATTYINECFDAMVKNHHDTLYA